MSQMEDRELLARKKEIALDMTAVLEKYRAIFSWDIPEVNIAAVDQVVLKEMALALKQLSQSSQASENNK